MTEQVNVSWGEYVSHLCVKRGEKQYRPPEFRKIGISKQIKQKKPPQLKSKEMKQTQTKINNNINHEPVVSVVPPKPDVVVHNLEGEILPPIPKSIHHIPNDLLYYKGIFYINRTYFFEKGNKKLMDRQKAYKEEFGHDAFILVTGQQLNDLKCRYNWMNPTRLKANLYKDDFLNYYNSCDQKTPQKSINKSRKFCD
ncbi:Nid2 [Acrasis kona]|uniref:Nid2 n=1 Tax=Acrasis kona TaxID=1008807 RepID=A0AAW2YJH9_9EUKA